MKQIIQIKHDTTENYKNSVNFIPRDGELIMYDGITKNGICIEPPRFKMGDSQHSVSNLPFLELKLTSYNEDEEKLML